MQTQPQPGFIFVCLTALLLSPWAHAQEATIPAETSRLVDVRSLGARGDGVTLDTTAIQEAIERCARAGAGQVRFPPGRYLSGTIHLRSHVTLYLEAGATLIGTTNLTNYAVFFMVSDNVEFRNARFVGGWDGVHWRGAPTRWCHNVNTLLLEDVRLSAVKSDARPVVYADDVQNLVLDQIRYPEFKDVAEPVVTNRVEHLDWRKPAGS
jgi:Pectate lyase superfamily protein